MAVALTTDDFYDYPKSILHNYLSAADDLIEEVAKANQKSLNELLKRNFSNLDDEIDI